MTTPRRPAKGLDTFGMMWRAGSIRRNGGDGSSGGPLPRRHHFRTGALRAGGAFQANADANDLILQMRTWERHDVGTTPGFDGDVERALRSIEVPVLYMPSETDMYFPLSDARYEAAFIAGVFLVPIPSLWGHTAGAASNPADARFLNDKIGAFLSVGASR